MNKIILPMLIMWILGGILGYGINELLQEPITTINYDKLNNSCSMRFPDKNLTNGINGVYQHDKYFCVWTKDRTREEIAGTTFHELAHYFNYGERRDHFAEDFEEYNYGNRT